jgi:hypothetical protein
MRLVLISMVVAVALTGGPQAFQTGKAAPPAGAIAGTVVDAATGRAVDGAVVHLAPETGASSLQAPLQMTDAKGRFLFAALPRGSYVLRASKSGYSEGAYGRDADHGVNLRPITVDGNQPFLNATIAIARPSSISGVVRDEAGEPMVNVFVRALRVVLTAGVERVAAGRVTSTDDRGAYRLAGLAPGRYIVMLPSVSASAPATRAGELLARSREAAARSSLTTRTPRPDGALAGDAGYILIAGAYPMPPGRESRAYPPLFHPGGRAVAAGLPIALAPGESRAGIDFAWAPVPASMISGRLVGPTEAVANTLVRLTPLGSESLPSGGEAATTLTGQDGSFTFLRVPHGEYTLIASRSYAYLSDGDSRILPRPPGFREGWGGGFTIPGSDVGASFLSDQTADTHTARQHLVASGPIAGLTVQLHPNVTLRGRVVIESGAFEIQGGFAGTTRPPPTGPVRAEPADGDLALGVPGGTFDSVTGTFFVNGLQPGEYTLSFMGLPMIKSITAGGTDFTTRPIDTANPRGLDDIVVTMTDKVATISGVVRSGGSEALASAVIYFPTDRSQWSRYGLRPTRIGSASVSNSGAYKIEVPAGEYFLLAVPARQTRLWQDRKRLEAAALVATRITVKWDEQRSQLLTVTTVKEAR